MQTLVDSRADHLRNHGFIHHPGGWCLAPAYDMNPSTKKDEHFLALDDSNTLPDLDTVMPTAEPHRVNGARTASRPDKSPSEKLLKIRPGLKHAE
jgi:serine/threonine-protein kinase HipA